MVVAFIELPLFDDPQGLLVKTVGHEHGFRVGILVLLVRFYPGEHIRNGKVDASVHRVRIKAFRREKVEILVGLVAPDGILLQDKVHLVPGEVVRTKDQRQLPRVRVRDDVVIRAVRILQHLQEGRSVQCHFLSSLGKNEQSVTCLI